jgi:hypothetical protein
LSRPQIDGILVFPLFDGSLRAATAKVVSINGEALAEQIKRENAVCLWNNCRYYYTSV